MYARHTMRRLVVLKLRVTALTGRTLNLQKAVLSLLQLTKMCQMTISIASCTTPLHLPEQHQNHRVVPRKHQRCCNSLLLHRLLAKVTVQPAMHTFSEKRIAFSLKVFTYSYAHLGSSRGPGSAAESCCQQVPRCCKPSHLDCTKCCCCEQRRSAACCANARACHQHDVQTCGQCCSHATCHECSTSPWQTISPPEPRSVHESHPAALGIC